MIGMIKNDIKNSHKKHKWVKIDKKNANGQYPSMEDKLDKYIVELRARGVCVSYFMIKVEALQIIW